MKNRGAKRGKKAFLALAALILAVLFFCAGAQTAAMPFAKASAAQTAAKASASSKSTKTKKSSAKPKVSEYKRLQTKLKKELEKKRFSKQVNLLFYDTFERLYKNYPTWKKGYKDLPSREKYITENLINVIKSIQKIDFYAVGTKKGNEMEEEANSLGWTTFDEKDRLVVSIIANKAGKVDADARNRDVEDFFHEISHCKQGSIMIYSSDYFNGNKKVENLYLEGAATFNMKFANPLSDDVGGIWPIENKKGTREIQYCKDTGCGYIVDLNMYEKLVYLAGYGTMDKVERGKVPLSAVEKAIGKKYGKKQAKKFIKTMNDCYVAYMKSHKGDRVYNLAIDLEKQFLKFVERDIDALKTKKQAKSFKQIYDVYIERNLPAVVNPKTSKSLTRKIFNLSALDKKLSKKLR